MANCVSSIVLVIVLLFPFASYSDQLETSENTKQYKLLVLGDSLSAAYGLTQEEGWVHLLQNAWTNANTPIDVVNGAISGDTTDGGLARLPRLLDLHKPTHLLIELGGNDALQGHNPKKIRSNIVDMVNIAKESNVAVMIQEMQIPTNYGRRYTTMFTDVFRSVAEDQEVPLIPFFLEEIALDKNLMQNDGIHPTAEAQPMIVEFMMPRLQALIIDTHL
ncbi:arylesterase [Glaciecola sp. MH2013]|uniref:arylesterase n=1 Tax=Glaciecola sp. MH2013 TaxID=2785524 RepID=UPI00189D108E|nr:arylesterase [Glaciecola sp. MH2013]MBF7073152.1 arylesterase [Glaciecola sp. MH2013]